MGLSLPVHRHGVSGGHRRWALGIPSLQSRNGHVVLPAPLGEGP